MGVQWWWGILLFTPFLFGTAVTSHHLGESAVMSGETHYHTHRIIITTCITDDH